MEKNTLERILSLNGNGSSAVTAGSSEISDFKKTLMLKNINVENLKLREIKYLMV